MVEALGDARGIRHGFVAGARALTLELHIDNGLNGIETEALPAVLDLDVGQSEAVLQRAGHLQRTMLACTALGATDMERWTLETCARRKTLLATSSCSAMVMKLQFGGSQRRAEVDNFWVDVSRRLQLAKHHGPGAEVTAARNVRRGWKRLARRRQPHRPNRVKAAYQRRFKCRK
jgi:hypothetical protein